MWKSISRFTLTTVLLAMMAGAAVAQEAKLLAVLRSDATVEKKAAACRELAQVATKEAIPPLTALLGDEKLGHMARHALETIPDPSVDDALREAMGKLKGMPLVGVIGSLGVRRDAKAVEGMAKLLGDSDAEVAQAAARALGKIGTPEAASALEAALAGAKPAVELAIYEGLFRCAESWLSQADGVAAKPAYAQGIYDRLRGLRQSPQQVRVGALRGAILVRKQDGIPLMLEAIRGADYVLTAAAARAALELPGSEITAALAEELPKLPADKQILIINTLGYRGDASAGPALLALGAKSSGPVRLAAVRNLTHLGYAPALTLLAELSLARDAELSSAARACLSSFPGKDAEAAIQAMLGHADAKVRALAVEVIGQRNAPGSVASLLKAAGDENQPVRIAALRALRDQAGVAELPALLAILAKADSPAEMQTVEGALVALCARQSEPAQGNLVIVKAEYGDLPAGPLADVTKKVADLVKAGTRGIEASNGNFGDPANGIAKKLRVDYTINGVAASKTVREQETLSFTAPSPPPAVVDAIGEAMAASKGQAKLALLRVLRSAGGPKALQTLKEAAGDQEAQVRDTALRELCEWPTPDALPLLGELIKTAPSETLKILALRGFVRLAPQQDATDAKKLESLKETLALAGRDEEKRLVLSALVNVPTVDSLRLVTSHLDHAALKEEACLAAVAIGEKIVASHGPEVASAMQQVAKQTTDAKLAERAKAIAEQAKK